MHNIPPHPIPRDGSVNAPVAMEIKDVSIGYGGDPVLKDVSTSFKSSNVTALVGPNGAGKSTLLRAMAGVHHFTGSILAHGKSLKDMKRAERVQELSFVEQHNESSTDLTVREVVEMGILVGRGPFAGLDSSDEDLVDEAIDHLGIRPLEHRQWNTMSGGEKQRTQLARAMAQHSNIMLLDEPTNHLDLHHQIKLMEQLHHISRNHGTCVVLAQHDLEMASRYCDEVVVLAPKKGVVAHGTPTEVFTSELMLEVFGLEAHRIEDGSLRVTGAVDTW